MIALVVPSGFALLCHVDDNTGHKYISLILSCRQQVHQPSLVLLATSTIALLCRVGNKYNSLWCRVGRVLLLVECYLLGQAAKAGKAGGANGVPAATKAGAGAANGAAGATNADATKAAIKGVKSRCGCLHISQHLHRVCSISFRMG